MASIVSAIVAVFGFAIKLLTRSGRRPSSMEVEASVIELSVDRVMQTVNAKLRNASPGVVAEVLRGAQNLCDGRLRTTITTVIDEHLE